jgi:hypothetical protein
VSEQRVTNSGVADTPPEVEAVVLDAYRHMDGREKLRRVASLRHSIEHLARTRIRAQYGEEMTEREMRLRLAALRLGPRLMVQVFDWDPQDHGY